MAAGLIADLGKGQRSKETGAFELAKLSWVPKGVPARDRVRDPIEILMEDADLA